MNIREELFYQSKQLFGDNPLITGPFQNPGQVHQKLLPLSQMAIDTLEVVVNRFSFREILNYEN
jgi:hypothetical protein